MNRPEETHDFGGKAGTVAKADNGGIKIIQVGLVLGLKLMKKVEEAESEHGMGLNEGRRKPCHSEQLTAAMCGIFWETRAVAKDNLVDAGYVENSELAVVGRVWAWFANRVAQLKDETEGGKLFLFEMCSVPSL
jgi:hypothetical protein